MTDFGLAVAKTQQAVRNEPQAIQMIKKIKESNEGRRLVCDCFGLYGFYSSLDISSFGFRILPWHLWQRNRESAAPIEGARYRDISAMGSGDGAG